MSQLADKFYSPEEYLSLEEKARSKSEFFQGRVFLMAGGSANHNRICGNAFLLLSLALRQSSGEVFTSDIRILVQSSGLYTYADAAVVCGAIEFAPGRDDTIVNPILLVEVLSPTTRNYDRGDKFELYRGLDSLQTYLIIEQSRTYVELHQKQPDGSWQLQTFSSPEQSLSITIPPLEISVAELYQRVKFPTRLPRQPRERFQPHPRAGD